MGTPQIVLVLVIVLVLDFFRRAQNVPAVRPVSSVQLISSRFGRTRSKIDNDNGDEKEELGRYFGQPSGV
jgi:hypothetical protein